jgi:single-strand DNA-binding protein
LVRCVSYFSKNTQFLGVLFFAILPRLLRVDSTSNKHGYERRGGLEMNSFTLTAVGHMARNPEVIAKGDSACTRFCLIGNDYGGKDEEGVAREVTTSVWFVAFGAIGDSIAQHSRKGDQLIVEARVRSNIWTDKQGEKQYDHSFIVQGFKFGAPGKVKREERNGHREQTLGLPRAEERGIGQDRQAAEAPDSAGAGRESRPEGSAEDANEREEAGAGHAEGAASASGYATVGPSAFADRSTGEVRESTGTSVSASPVSRPVESHAVGPVSAPAAASAARGTKAAHHAKATQEKAKASRSSRKTTASTA